MPLNFWKKHKQLAIEDLLPGGFYFRQPGFCPCCQQETIFLALDSWLRDHFKCQNCNSIPRNRALLHVLGRYYPNWRELDIHESSSSGDGASFRLRSDCRGYVSSQYYADRSYGEVFGGQRNENLEAQTFPDAVFDVVITQDVMEHIYDPAAAFREIARTLKPGGAHVFGVPIVNKHNPSQVWATKNSDGSPNFLFEPEYHGNPVDSRGAPVTMRWGYDIVDFIKEATGLETVIEYVDDLSYGIRAEYIEVLVTRRPA